MERLNSSSLNKDILKIAIPAIFNNITVPLLGLCDTAIAGHLPEVAALGAIAVGSMMLNVIFWLCGFLRAGTSGLAANACGARDDKALVNVLYKSLVIAAFISLVVLLFQRPLLSLLLELLGPSGEVKEMASTYFRIVIWGTPAQLAIMAISGWFIGIGNTVVPMIVAVGVNVINIILSLTLVFGFGFGFTGIACGTLAANWFGFILALIFVIVRFRRIGNRNSGTKVRWRNFFTTNINLFLRSACILSVSMTITGVASRLGEEILAVNAIMMQFFLFFSYFMDGFAFAGEALAGQSYGRKDMAGVDQCTRALLKWGAYMAIIFTTIYFVGGRQIVTLLTENVNVITGVTGMMPWLIALPAITVAAFLFDGVYIGMTKTFDLLVTTLAACVIFYGVAFFRETPIVGNSLSQLWLAFELYLGARGLLLGVLFMKYRRKSLNL